MIGNDGTKFIERAPKLMCYIDEVSAYRHLSRLVAEFSAFGVG